MGVDGLYGRSGIFEDVIERFTALITKFGADAKPEVLRFPPGLARKDFEKSGYFKNFPDMAGRSTPSRAATRSTRRSSTSCMPTSTGPTSRNRPTSRWRRRPATRSIPSSPRRGPLPTQGGLYDLYSYCFRHEPSKDTDRMQMFRQREYVRIGTPDQVTAFRETWLKKAPEIVSLLELPFTLEVANDPFFGRAARMLKASQRDQELKFELLIPINDGKKPTACISFNYHQDHFGSGWDLRTSADDIAHTACVGFGMERLALALFKTHGLDVDLWPRQVRDALWS